MKKFIFSLDVLLQIKKTLKDKLQTEHAAAAGALDKALRIKVCLDKVLMDEAENYEAKVKNGIFVGDIQAHAIYMEELQEMIAAATHDVTRAQEEVNRKQAALLEIFKEIRVLEKLRRKQYLEYLTEEKKQETNAREDMLSYHVAGKTASYGSPGSAS